MLEAPQLLWAHVLVLLRLTGKIFLGLDGISFSSCFTSARSQKAKQHLDKKFTIPNSQQNNNQKLCISMCVCILNSHPQLCKLTSVWSHPQGPFPFLPCQSGANTGDNTLSSEYLSKYGGILEIHRADFNALQSLLHLSVKILTAGLIHV